MDVLHLIVDCHTSHYVWRTLEKFLMSPSNSHIIQLYRSFQNLRQGDASVTMYMQQAKLLSMCFVVRGEFKELVASLMTKAELFSYANLHSHFLTHKFLHKTSLQTSDTSSPSLPQSPL
jgi:hypothetical protein